MADESRTQRQEPEPPRRPGILKNEAIVAHVGQPPRAHFLPPDPNRCHFQGWVASTKNRNIRITAKLSDGTQAEFAPTVTRPDVFRKFSEEYNLQHANCGFSFDVPLPNTASGSIRIQLDFTDGHCVLHSAEYEIFVPTGELPSATRQTPIGAVFGWRTRDTDRDAAVATMKTRPAAPAAVICGIENGGTTLLLDMLKAHPRVYARFEVGLLLAKSLRFEDIMACQPYIDMLRVSHRLPLDHIRRVAGARDWPSAYERLLRVCLSREIDRHDLKRDFFIDKTPGYSPAIHQVIERVPGVPVVGVIRDPRGVYASMKKRVLQKNQHVPKGLLPGFCRKYQKYITPLALAALASPDVLLVRYEELATSPAHWLPEICRHIGLDYLPEMTDPGNSFAPQQNSYGQLDPRKIAEFKQVISREEEEKLTDSLGPLNWTLYPVEQRLQEVDLTAFGDAAPALPARIAERLGHLPNPRDAA